MGLGFVLTKPAGVVLKVSSQNVYILPQTSPWERKRPILLPVARLISPIFLHHCCDYMSSARFVRRLNVLKSNCFHLRLSSEPKRNVILCTRKKKKKKTFFGG